MSCHPNQMKLCGVESCQTCWPRSFQTCWPRSFASHPLAAFWSPKNADKPWSVRITSNIKRFFFCNDCGHNKIEMIVSNVVTGSKKGNKKVCGYCNGKLLCENDNGCIFCWEKSFASHEKANDWSLKNKLTPRQVCKISSEKYYFNCKNCNHKDTLYRLSDIVWCTIKKVKNMSTCETYCGYCNGDLLCNKNCDFCHQNSFASIDKSEFWSWDNPDYPSQVRKRCNKNAISIVQIV